MANNAPTSLPPSTDATYGGQSLVVFTAVFMPAQVVAVALRYYSRWLLKNWGLDDLIVLISLASQLLIGSLCLDAVHHGGVGYHVPYLEAHAPQKLTIWGKYLVALSVLYFAAVNIPKIAILILYGRLFPNRSTRIIIKALLVVLISLTISNVVADLAACRPFKANWETNLPGARCIDKEAFFIWGSIPNIITDVVMLVLPMPMVWKLHTSKRIKLGLTITFAVGSFGLVTSIIRFTTFFQNNSFTDGTYSAVALLTWTQVEAGVYLVSACLPTYKPLLERIGTNTISRVAQGSKVSKGYSGSYGAGRNRLDDTSISDIPLNSGISTFGIGTRRHDDWSEAPPLAHSSRDISVTTNIEIERHDRKGHNIGTSIAQSDN